MCAQSNLAYVVCLPVGFALEMCRTEKPCWETRVAALRNVWHLPEAEAAQSAVNSMSELESSAGVSGCEKHQPKFFPTFFQCRLSLEVFRTGWVIKRKQKKTKPPNHPGGLERTGKIREKQVVVNLKTHLNLCCKYKY